MIVLLTGSSERPEQKTGGQKTVDSTARALITGWRRIQRTSLSNCLPTSPSVRRDARRFANVTVWGIYFIAGFDILCIVDKWMTRQSAALRLTTEHFERVKPDDGKKRSRGWHRKTWAALVYGNAGTIPSVLWSYEIAKDRGAVQRSSETMRQWWWWWWTVRSAGRYVSTLQVDIRVIRDSSGSETWLIRIK